MICQQDRTITTTPRDAAIAALPPGAQPHEAPVIYDISTDHFRFATQADVDEMGTTINSLAIKLARAQHDLNACHEMRRSGASPV